MTLLRSRTDAPHLNRTVLIAPNRRYRVADFDHPLATIVPRTRLGAVALDLAMATSMATIQIIATTTYVNALTALAPPVINFQAPPPGTTISVQSLQQQWEQFCIQLALLQGNAASWVSTSSSTGGASILSTLVTITNMIATLNPMVQADFMLLPGERGTPVFANTLQGLQSLIGAEQTPLSSMATQIEALSTNLDIAAQTLVSNAQSGVLAQLLQAYASEIAALNQDIEQCNQQIADDNSKIIGLGFATGTSAVVGIVGLLNIWNPLGWAMLGGGIAGTYFAIAEIETLEGQIAVLQGQIKNDYQQGEQDAQAAMAVDMFSNSAQGAANMNSAAQQELNTLIQLCTTLVDDMTDALADLNPGNGQDPDQAQLNAALAEWNEIVEESGFLAGITAYIWPSCTMLTSPNNLAAGGASSQLGGNSTPAVAQDGGVALVSNSGATYGYASSGGSWSGLPGSSLSAVSVGNVLVAIDGAPNDGTNLQPNTYGQTFYAKVFDMASNAWTSISTFPVAQVTTDGASIWAINQVTSDRQVYRYNGEGTSWTAVGAMPNLDCPMLIAATTGNLFAIANNGRGLWTVSAGSGIGWQQIGSATYNNLSANSGVEGCVNVGWVGLIDSSNNAWLFSTANNNSLTAMMTGVSVLAQAPDGSQYAIDQSLNLWHVSLPQGGSGPVNTQLRTNVVGVSVSTAGAVYAIDNTGSIWTLTDLANNSWQELPALPLPGNAAIAQLTQPMALQ